MKTLSIAGALAGFTLAAPHAHAAPATLQGSDTLFQVVSDSISAAGLNDDLSYAGGGSGTGETGMLNGTQGIAPMSRALTASAVNTLITQGVTPIQHVIGLDGVSLFVSSDTANDSFVGIDIPTIRSIYLCTTTDWSQVPASGKSGPILVYARNGDSGTTDTFKTLIGGLPATTKDANGVNHANWASCVNEVLTTEDIASNTAGQVGAIGFAGLSGKVEGNKELGIATTTGGTAIAPSVATIRDFSYPLARRLYVNQVSDARNPSDAEQALLDAMTDRGFEDPILSANGFVTCLADEDGGCP